jgi:hypothetical protein
MRRLRIPVLRLGVGLLLASAAASAGAEETDWRSYRSEPGRFAIDVPGNPSRADEPQNSEIGTIQGSAWTIEGAGAVLRIEHFDLPRIGSLLLTDHRLLSIAADRMLADRSGREIEREHYTLIGRSALRVRYARGDLGDTVEEARFVLAGRRLYAAYAREAAPGSDAAPAIARFLDSLEVWDE